MKTTAFITLLLFGASAFAGETPNPGPSPLALKGPKPKPITPPKPEALDAAIKKGIAFLLKDQNKNGSWGSPHLTKGLNIYTPVPGGHNAMRAAVTALCLSALLETGQASPEAVAAIDRGEIWLVKHLPSLRRATDASLRSRLGNPLRRLVASSLRRFVTFAIFVRRGGPNDHETCQEVAQRRKCLI